MGANNRSLVLLGGVVLVVIVLAGWGLKAMLARPKSPQEAMEEYARQAQAQAQAMAKAQGQMPDMAKLASMTRMSMPDGMKLPRGAMAAFANILPPGLVMNATELEAMNKLIAEQHLSKRAAAYLVKSQIQLIDQTKTSTHFLMTFPDGGTIEETLTVLPNQAYTPTATDLERAARTGSRVYNPHVKFKKNGTDSLQATLEYNVPYSALPKEVLEKIGAPAPPNSAGFFNLVPPAWGQGRAIAEPTAGLFANMLAEHFKAIDRVTGEELETFKSLGADVPLALLDLILSMKELGGQLSQIGDLQDCAKNPTNPLTQKASQDPNYAHDVLDPLSDAKGNVGSSWLPRVANVGAGYLTHFLPFGGGFMLGPLLAMNDDAINSINEDRIKDAEKLVVECDKETELEAMGYRPMAGKFEYKFNGSYRNCTNNGSESGCNFSTTVIEEQGTFVIDPNATEESAAAANRGSGTSKDDGGFENPKCNGESHTLTSGTLKVTVEVMGPPESAVLRLVAGSDEWTGTLDSSNNCSVQAKPQHQTWRNAGAPGVDCKFTKVNMIKGGHFATFSESDRGRGTCTIDLERK